MFLPTTNMAAEEVNGVTGASTSIQNTDMSESPGCALLIVIGEPATPDHRELILEKVTNGLKVWNPEITGLNLNNELQALTLQNPEPEENATGDLTLHQVTETVAVDVLFNPTQEAACCQIRNFLLAPNKHRLLLYSGHALEGSGDWLLQDDLMPFERFAAISKEVDVENALKQTEGGSLNIYAFAEGHWNKNAFSKMEMSKSVDLILNGEACESDSAGHHMFVSYLSQYVKVKPVKELLLPSDIVGNIRFSRPTLYIFPGYQGDSALFGISGFNLLINGGYGRKACFWEFTRHLDRIDACLITHLGADNMLGLSSVLERKAHENVHPEIGHVFMNGVAPQKHSPNGDLGAENGGVHKTARLLMNLSDEGSRLIDMLQQIGKPAHPLTGSISSNGIQPMNLYHKVGHGSLDMYVLNPIQDAKDVKDFLGQWSKHVATFTTSNSVINVGGKSLPIPLPHQVSICALLVWRPACPTDQITRILFPGSAPQNKLFDGLDKIKNLDIFQTASAKQADLNVSHGTPKKTASKSAGKTPSSRASPVPKADSKRSEIKKAPAKGIQQKTNKDQLNKKTIADRKKSPSATPKSSSPKSTPATSRTASRTPSVATPEEKASTPTPSEPELKADPVPEKIEPVQAEKAEAAPEPKEPERVPEKIEAVLVEKVEAAPEPKEPEPVPEKIEVVSAEKVESVPEPKEAEPAPEKIEAVLAEEVEAAPESKEPEKVEPEPETKVAESTPEAMKETPPAEPEPVEEEAPAPPTEVEPAVEPAPTPEPTPFIDEPAPVSEPAAPVTEEEVKLEVSTDVEAAPAGGQPSDGLLLDFGSAPPAEDKSPALESPEPLPDPVHFDTTSVEGNAPAADVQMEIPPVVDARPYDEKPADAEEHTKDERISDSTEPSLDVSAQKEDVFDLMGSPTDEGTANGHPMDDHSLNDDSETPTDPEPMSAKVMEDLGIFDGPETDSHSLPSHPPPHHDDPVLQNPLFDGASPEGLPEPVEPPMTPEGDIMDPREMDAAAAVEHVNKLPTPPPEDKFQPFTMEKAEVVQASVSEDADESEQVKEVEKVSDVMSTHDEDAIVAEKVSDVEVAPSTIEPVVPEKTEEGEVGTVLEEKSESQDMISSPLNQTSDDKMEELPVEHADVDDAVLAEKTNIDVMMSPAVDDMSFPERMDEGDVEKMEEVHKDDVFSLDQHHVLGDHSEAVETPIAKIDKEHKDEYLKEPLSDVSSENIDEPKVELESVEQVESKPDFDNSKVEKADEGGAMIEPQHDLSGDRIDEPETASVHDSSDDMSHEQCLLPPQEHTGFLEAEHSRMDEPLSPERTASPEIFGVKDEVAKKSESSEAEPKELLSSQGDQQVPGEPQAPVSPGGVLDEREFHPQDDEFASSDDEMISYDDDDVMKKEAKAFAMEMDTQQKELDMFDGDDSSAADYAGKPDEDNSEKDLLDIEKSDVPVSYHSDDEGRTHSASPITESTSQDLCPSLDIKDDLNKSASPELLHPSDADHSGMDKSHSDLEEDLHSEEVTAPTPASISEAALEDDVSLSEEHQVSQDNKVSEDPLSGLSAQSGFSMETSFHEQRDPLSSHSPVNDLTREPMEVEQAALGDIAATGAASCLQEPQDFPLSQESPLNSTQDDLSPSSESHPLDSHSHDQHHELDRSFDSSGGHSQEGHSFDPYSQESSRDQYVPGHGEADFNLHGQESLLGHQPGSGEIYGQHAESGSTPHPDDFSFGSHPGHQDHSFEIVDGPADGKALTDAINPFIGVPGGDEPRPPPPLDYDHFNGNAPQVIPAAAAAGHDTSDSALDRDSLERDFDPLKSWGQPMGLPAPPPPSDAAVDKKEEKKSATKKEATKKNPAAKADPKKAAQSRTTAAKKPATSATTKTKTTTGTAKKEAVNGKPGKPEATKTDNKRPTSTAGAKKPPAARPSSATATKAEPKKAAAGKRPATATATKSASAAHAEPATPVVPFYVDLTYVPYHGNQYYVDMNFFKRVRARYYVISALNPSPSVLNALLEAKQTWDSPDSEVTIIPTYDNDTLRHWMGLNHEQLAQLKVSVAPSAARCTIQLQDHEASCAAYRLEF